MEISLFYAKLFGIYYLVVAVVWLLRGPAFGRNVDHWIQEPGGKLLGGIVSLLMGGAIVASHQVYEVSWRGLITLIGYLAVLKGAILLGWPELFQFDYEKWSQGPARWLGGLFAVAVGTWFCWIGFRGT